ncbi:MAG TPA: DUF2938 family protein [bacterium]|nr:DUF2938 family protein [bacterium]
MGGWIVPASLVAGIFGTVGMDLVRALGARLGVMTWGISPLIGRWVLASLHRGIRWGVPIEKEPGRAGEYPVAILGHYFFGALFGFVYVLIIPAAYWGLVSGLLFAQVTLPLIWFVLYPGMGLGWFGSRLGVARSLFTTIAIHIVYGLILGALMGQIPKSH